MDVNIEKLVISHVQQELSHMDVPSLIEGEIGKFITKIAEQKMKTAVNEVANSIITEEITKVLDGPVSTDDGWGRREKYDSFDDLVRVTFKKKLDDSYAVKTNIQKWVKERINTLFNNEQSAILKKITDEMVATTKSNR